MLWQEHVRACPDRASLERYVYSIGQQPAAAAVAVVQPPQPPAPPRQEQEEENWDDVSEHSAVRTFFIVNNICLIYFYSPLQVNEPTYNPQDYVQRAPVLRTLNCAPPAQRKAFREAERLRLNNLK